MLLDALPNNIRQLSVTLLEKSWIKDRFLYMSMRVEFAFYSLKKWRVTGRGSGFHLFE